MTTTHDQSRVITVSITHYYHLNYKLIPKPRKHLCKNNKLNVAGMKETDRRVGCSPKIFISQVTTFIFNFGNNFFLNPFSTKRRYKRHQNKVKVKGLGRNNPELAGFLLFHGSLKKFNQLAKKHYFKFFSRA